MKTETKTKTAKVTTKAPAKEKKAKGENPMREIMIEKVVISAGAVDDELVKAKKLIELVTSKKAQIMKSSKRIPDFNVRPGLEVGTCVTLRREDGIQVLRRILTALDNTLKKKQIEENHFSFGIKEYIDIPGMEYQRDIGIRGFNTTVVFVRRGLRVKRKKIKMGHVPHRQYVSAEEIIKFMKDKFKTKFI